jgi:hypothetical protein
MTTLAMMTLAMITSAMIPLVSSTYLTTFFVQLPKTGARMNDPMTSRFLSDSFLYESFLRAEELHRQLVVRRLEHALQVVPHPPRLRFGGTLKPRNVFVFFNLNRFSLFLKKYLLVSFEMVHVFLSIILIINSEICLNEHSWKCSKLLSQEI